jgi:hypothetical protein
MTLIPVPSFDQVREHTECPREGPTGRWIPAAQRTTKTEICWPPTRNSGGGDTKEFVSVYKENLMAVVRRPRECPQGGRSSISGWWTPAVGLDGRETLLVHLCLRGRLAADSSSADRWMARAVPRVSWVA